jgi:hypothetical protein
MKCLYQYSFLYTFYSLDIRRRKASIDKNENEEVSLWFIERLSFDKFSFRQYQINVRLEHLNYLTNQIFPHHHRFNRVMIMINQ